MGIRIVVAEDVDLVAEAFQALLEIEEDFEVIGRVSRGDELVSAVSRTLPDLVQADVDMPGATGIEATALLRRLGYRAR